MNEKMKSKFGFKRKKINKQKSLTILLLDQQVLKCSDNKSEWWLADNCLVFP